MLGTSRKLSTASLVLFLLLNVALPSVLGSSVSLDIGTRHQQNAAKVGTKLLQNTGLALAFTIVFGASIFFLIIWGIFTATMVVEESRSQVYKQLAIALVVSGGYFIFSLISYLGGAIWLAPVTEVEFWFLITTAIVFPLYVLGWSMRIGADFAKNKQQIVDMSRPGASEPMDGRAVWWMFITAVVFLSAAFAAFDITTSYTLAFGIVAAVLAAVWLVWLVFSWINAYNRAKHFKDANIKTANPSAYGWLQWFHIVLIVFIIFFLVLFLVGPIVQLTTVTYNDIMIGYFIVATLIILSQHIFYFVFDFDRRAPGSVQTTAMRGANNRFGLPSVGQGFSSLFNDKRN